MTTLEVAGYVDVTAWCALCDWCQSDFVSVACAERALADHHEQAHLTNGGN